MIPLQMFTGFVYFALFFAIVFAVCYIIKEKRDAVSEEDENVVDTGTQEIQ